MSQSRSPRLINGPCDRMPVGVPPKGTKPGTGVAVRLIGGGYALYSRGPNGHYYYDETVGEGELSFEAAKGMQK